MKLVNGTIPPRKEIRVALRAKQREGCTSRYTQKQAMHMDDCNWVYRRLSDAQEKARTFGADRWLYELDLIEA